VPPASRRKTSSQTLKLPDVLVVDANVLLSALIGGRAAGALAELGPAHVRAAAPVGDEVRRWLPELAAKRRLDLTSLVASFQIAPVRWCASETYGWLERWARGRMAGRDEDDWPTVALARALTLTSDGRRGPMVPRAWVGRLPESTWPIAWPAGAGKTVAVWSQDKDFEVSGLPVWKTGQVLRALGC
jgi:hypothetical protein